MWTDLFWASLWGGIVALDTTAAMQVMVSRPMVGCSIIGLILGNFQVGFTIGILLELLYISELPIGGARFAEGNVGATASAVIGILIVRQFPDRVSFIIVCALLLAIVISWFGGGLVLLMRRLNTKIYGVILRKKRLSPMHVNLSQLAGIIMAFLLGFSCVLVSALVFVSLLPMLLQRIPVLIDHIMQPVIGGLLAVGCVSLAHIFWLQGGKRVLLAVGVVIGVLVIVVGS